MQPAQAAEVIQFAMYCVMAAVVGFVRERAMIAELLTVSDHAPRIVRRFVNPV